MSGHDDPGSDNTSPFVFALGGGFFFPGFGLQNDDIVQDIRSRIEQLLQPAQGPRLQSRIQLFQLLHQLPTYGLHLARQLHAQVQWPGCEHILELRLAYRA